MPPSHPAFTLLHTQAIPELASTASLYRHNRSGAQLLSIENDDENKVFGITFRTPPPDSSGVAHILEHATLNGSRKYPLKEPFVQLIKGSLQTFVNAFTFPDKTCYPVASQNTADFYNLVDVYLDAVFYPLLDPYTFKQEGWHYELDDPAGLMSFKGVVFNEMKGAYSSPDSLLEDQSLRQLFPDTIYNVDSGGDPAVIPTLTYAAFRSFHASYYHPANARIYFWGDDDPAHRLELLDAYLKDYQAIPVSSAVALQPPLTAPRTVRLPYEAESGGLAAGPEARALFTINWLLPEDTDPQLSLGLGVLNHILSATPASPLRKTLIESGLGEDLAGQGLMDGLRQLAYSAGLKGVRLEDVPAAEQLILDTLASLARDGFDPDTVAASLNSVEFGLRENNTGQFPRGLAVMLRALSTWLHDGDPFQSLLFDAPLTALQGRVRSGERYFESLLQTYFLDNPHRVTVILEPDEQLAARRAAAEQARLDEARAALTPAQLQALADDTAELKRRQQTPDSPQALASIPALHLADIDRQARRIPLEQPAAGLLFHNLPTNGILYLDLAFNLHSLPPNLLPYIPLFARALTQMGTRRQSFVQFIQRIGSQTGGIFASPFISAAPVQQSSGPERTQSEAWLVVRGKSLAPKGQALFDILGEALTEANFADRARFRQIALEEKSGYESWVVRSGNSAAVSRLKAHFNEAGWAAEQVSGLSQLFFLRRLLEQIDADWDAVLARLEEVRARLLTRPALVTNVTLDAPAFATLRPALEAFLAGLPSAPPSLLTAQQNTIPLWPARLPGPSEGWSIPSQVNYVARSADLFQAGYRLHGSILAIMKLLGTTWLWEKVRVQGGAYGGRGDFDLYSGVLTFSSFRDPNLLQTLAIYDQTPAFLRSLALDQAEIERAIIGAISQLDAYLLPDAKGLLSLQRHLLGISDEWRQQFRDELLATRPEDFQSLANAMQIALASGLAAVVGSAEAIQAANAAQPGLLEVGKVL